jgi:hypothetical protein
MKDKNKKYKYNTFMILQNVPEKYGKEDLGKFICKKESTTMYILSI